MFQKINLILLGLIIIIFPKTLLAQNVSSSLNKHLGSFYKKETNTKDSLSNANVISNGVTISGTTVYIPKNVADSLTFIRLKADSLERLLSKRDSIRIKDSLVKLQKDTVSALLVAKSNTEAFKKQLSGSKLEEAPKKDLSEDEWQKEYLITEANAYKSKHELLPDYKVFGWHPYWMGTAYKSYNYDLLSMVAYFSFELNPQTGLYYSIHDWETTPLVDSAKAHNTKVLLTVSSFGRESNAIFLANQNQQQKAFINTIVTLLRLRNADGVNINFEDIPLGSREAMTNFMIDLSTSLKALNNKYIVTLSLPVKDIEGVYDVKQLNSYIDHFIVMGYEFYGKYSQVAGPLSPLGSGSIWWEYNLAAVVLEYKASGIDLKKSILALPYYGAEWQTSDLTFPSKVENFVRYVSFKEIRDKFGVLPCCEEASSNSKFHVYRDEQNRYRQVWYEDSVTLFKKYNFIKEQGLGGAGIWALGYDNGYDDLWKTLARSFAKQPDLKEQNFGLSANMMRRGLDTALRIARNPGAVLRSPAVFVSAFGSLLGLSVIGILVLIRYGCQLKQLMKVGVQSLITLLIIIAIALLFFAFKVAEMREIAFLFGGLLLGVLIFFIYSRRFLLERDMP
jgi:spore germination protein YaaH